VTVEILDQDLFVLSFQELERRQTVLLPDDLSEDQSRSAQIESSASLLAQKPGRYSIQIQAHHFCALSDHFM
jgi:hypothetical protein